MNRFLILLALCCFTGIAAVGQDIRINQIGFYPGAPKIAVVYGDQYESFSIVDSKNRTVLEGKLSSPRKSPFSDKMTRVADFSSLSRPGEFKLIIGGANDAVNIVVRPDVHSEVVLASMKAFYFHRLSSPLEETYAGKWHRPAGHPDDQVKIHSSAISPGRPADAVISSPRGWYDAGDYNKYIVNSGITMGTLLSSYEDFSEYWKDRSLNIPESKNDVPDILDELLWNLRWMLTMQDPNDGGVYHKLTNASFDGMVMPHQATRVRYVVQKGTAASLDFAAVMAQASRILKPFEKQLPGLSDSCLNAAKLAWAWSIKNPAVEYDQNKINQASDPDITTGAYGDRDFSDEFIWAASELTVTTASEEYAATVKLVPDDKAPLPSWGQVRLLGYYSLIRKESTLPKGIRSLLPSIKKSVLSLAESLAVGTDEHYMRTVMGKSKRDYIWGSTSVAANQSIALVQAYFITREKRYIDYALSNYDFLLGRNGTGYCFVTGFGTKKVMNPHHRPSEADGISDPVPGWLSGGPNPSMQDRCKYPSSIADEAFVDDVCSYASNEVAINWNAPLVYVGAAMEALQTVVKY